MNHSNLTYGPHVNKSNGINLLYTYFVSGFKAETAGIFHCDMYAYNLGIASKIRNNCIIKNKIIAIDPTLFVYSKSKKFIMSSQNRSFKKF